jgi:hypothetical protein
MFMPSLLAQPSCFDSNVPMEMFTIEMVATVKRGVNAQPKGFA